MLWAPPAPPQPARRASPPSPAPPAHQPRGLERDGRGGDAHHVGQRPHEAHHSAGLKDAGDVARVAARAAVRLPGVVVKHLPGWNVGCRAPWAGARAPARGPGAARRLRAAGRGLRAVGPQASGGAGRAACHQQQRLARGGRPTTGFDGARRSPGGRACATPLLWHRPSRAAARRPAWTRGRPRRAGGTRAALGLARAGPRHVSP